MLRRVLAARRDEPSALLEAAGAVSAVAASAFFVGVAADSSPAGADDVAVAFSFVARTRDVELRVREVAGLASDSALTVGALSVFWRVDRLLVGAGFTCSWVSGVSDVSFIVNVWQGTRTFKVWEECPPPFVFCFFSVDVSTGALPPGIPFRPLWRFSGRAKVPELSLHSHKKGLSHPLWGMDRPSRWCSARHLPSAL